MDVSELMCNGVCVFVYIYMLVIGNRLWREENNYNEVEGEEEDIITKRKQNVS